MLIAFLGLVALVDAALGLIGEWIGAPFGYTGTGPLPQFSVMFLHHLPICWVFRGPIAFMLVNYWVKDGTQRIYRLRTNDGMVPARFRRGLERASTLILTYALCGFANFGSVGIQIGGLGGIAPDAAQN